MNYLSIQIPILESELREILTAELAEIGFEAFEDKDTVFEAYILEENFEQSKLDVLIERYQELIKFTYTIQEIERKNWNEEWEKSYQPVFIADKCVIKSSFHQLDKKFPYEILINPKMSFGTGHHETTTLMIENQLNISHHNKKVLDLGCGTGVLSIMASKLGAKFIDACDIDEWAVENSQENFELNKVNNVKVFLGTVENVSKTNPYQIILANINKNVLLKEIPEYSIRLDKEGFLILSGFYEKDMVDLEKITKKNRLERIEYKSQNHWVSALYQKVS